MPPSLSSGAASTTRGHQAAGSSSTILLEWNLGRSLARPVSRISFRTCLTVLLGLLVVLFWLQYRYGIGLTSDSALFISTAESLLRGHGLTTSVGTLTTSAGVSRTPVAHHPPLYPILLAGGKLMTGDFRLAATFLNFVSFLCCFIGAYLFVFRRSSTGPALATVCMLAASVSIYSIHYTLGTDGPAMPFLIAGMCCLQNFDRGRNNRALVLSALALAAACLVRYAYLAFLPAGCIVLLLDDNEPLRQRLRQATLFGLVACAPVAIVATANLFVAGTATNRVMAFHPVTYSKLCDGADYLSSWLLPRRVPLPLRFGTLLVLYLAGCVVALRGGSWRYSARITTVFLASYIAFLLLSTSLFDEATPLDERMLAPAILMLCLHAGIVSGSLWFSSPRWHIVPALIVIVVVVHGSGVVANRILNLYKFREQGSSLAKLKAENRDLLPILAALPSDAAIFSNVPGEIYLVSGRSARTLPVVRGYTDARLRTEPEINAQAQHLWADLRQHNGIVVYRLRGNNVSDLSTISREDLSRRLPLTPILQSNRFAVFSGGASSVRR